VIYLIYFFVCVCVCVCVRARARARTRTLSREWGGERERSFGDIEVSYSSVTMKDNKKRAFYLFL